MPFTVAVILSLPGIVTTRDGSHGLEGSSGLDVWFSPSLRLITVAHAASGEKFSGTAVGILQPAKV